MPSANNLFQFGELDMTTKKTKRLGLRRVGNREITRDRVRFSALMNLQL